MGVSGTGKTTVARRLADAFGARFLEGDAFHPPGSIAKMRAGVPLTDEDRRPWLAELAERVRAHHDAGTAVVLTCSALRRVYRDTLRGAVPDGALVLVHLHAPYPVLEQRMRSRVGHFMPASLLRSQLETLEPLEPDEPGVVVDVTAEADSVVADALRLLASVGYVRRPTGP